MAKNRSYEDLQVWQQAIELAVLVYGATKNFPVDEKFGLVSQMRRAACSVGSNIAEGCSRNGLNEFQHFLGISQGSAAELKTQAIIANRVGLLANEVLHNLTNQIDTIARMLNALQKSLRTTNQQPATSNHFSSTSPIKSKETTL